MKVRKTNEAQELKNGLKDKLNACSSIKEIEGIWRQVFQMVGKRSKAEKKELNALFNAAEARLTTPTTELEKLAEMTSSEILFDDLHNLYYICLDGINVVEKKLGLQIEYAPSKKSTHIQTAEQCFTVLQLMGWVST